MQYYQILLMRSIIFSFFRLVVQGIPYVCSHVYAFIMKGTAFLVDVTVIPDRDPSVSSDYLPVYLRRISIPIGIYANRLTPANVPLAISAVHDRHY